MSKPDPLLGRTLGGIRIRKLLGRGGMGAVYEGYQEKLERKLAVKVMNPEHAKNPIAAEYFLREARSASGLRHPNIIQIYDFGEEDGFPYIAMEFVPGQSLEDLIKAEYPLAPERITHILDQTLSALEEAHANHIIHRDLKPENLMIEEGRDGRDFVKILDFGIAKPMDDVSPLTRQGAMVGTPHYMSPEQARGEPVDRRSDLFSMGIVLYQMLTNLLPFTDKALANILIKLIQEEPLSPSAARPDVEIHPGLESICFRAMKKKPQERYDSAGDFRRALASVHEDGPIAKAEDAPKMFVFKRNPTEVSRSKIAGLKARKARNSGSLKKPTSHDPQLFEPTSEPSEGAATAEPSPARVPGRVATLNTPYDFNLDEFKQDLLGQQSLATVLVVHQRASQRIEIEEQRRLRGALDEQFEQIARDFGGTTHSRRGDCMPIIFGATGAHVDDPLRAAEAAFRLREILRRSSPEHVTFGFAMAQGNVHVPPDGDVTRASGQPLDEAIEQARAAEDERVVAVGEQLRKRLIEVYELGAPVSDASVILGVQAAARILETEEDLIGREGEVAELLAGLGQLGRKGGAAFVLTGEAGMGKSILLGRLAGLARQRGFLVVGAHHRRAGAEGIRDVFRQWLTELALVTPTEQIPWEELVTECGLPEHIATMIMRWSSGETDAVFGRGSAQAMPGAEFNADEAIAGAFRQLFGAMTFKQPCVLIIDQIEAYDDGMARFFEDWAAFCKSSNVMFVAALQTIAGAEPPRLPGEAVHLSIAPFDDEIAMHFIESRLPWQASRPVLERLVEIAGGIPLYLEQLTIQLAGKQFDDVVGLNAWFGEVKGLGGALQLRLYAQPNNVRNVLGLLAVLGSGARARWVDKLASKSWEVDRALQKLYDEDLIKVRGPEARLYFDPLIFEKIVYEQLSGAQRLRVHGMAANFFIEQAQATSDPELLREYRCELIEHLARCGEFEAAREASHDLARDCLARFEYGPARQYLRKTLGLGMKVPGFSKVDRARLQLELSRIERVQGHVREAVDLVGPVHRDADLPALIRDEAALDLAELWLDSEDTGRVETLARRATDDIRARLASGTTTGGDDWLLVRALKVLGEILEKQARFPAAAQVLIEAVELNASQDVSAVHDPWRIRLLWEPLNQLGRLQLRMGRGAGAEKYLQQALALANRLGDVQGEIAARGNLASMYASTERLDQAYEILGEAKAIAGHAGDLKSICRLDYNLGLLYASQHRWEDARDVFTSSKKLASSLGWREGIALSLSQLRGVERALA